MPLLWKITKCCFLYKDNLKFTKFSDEATLMETDVMAALYKLGGHKEFDIVFMDPPYNLEIEAQVLKTMNNMASVTEYTTVIIEASLKRDLSLWRNVASEL